MNTPTQMKMSSASFCGMVPSATESATALAPVADASWRPGRPAGKVLASPRRRQALVWSGPRQAALEMMGEKGRDREVGAGAGIDPLGLERGIEGEQRWRQIRRPTGGRQA